MHRIFTNNQLINILKSFTRNCLRDKIVSSEKYALPALNRLQRMGQQRKSGTSSISGLESVSSATRQFRNSWYTSEKIYREECPLRATIHVINEPFLDLYEKLYKFFYYYNLLIEERKIIIITLISCKYQVYIIKVFFFLFVFLLLLNDQIRQGVSRPRARVNCCARPCSFDGASAHLLCYLCARDNLVYIFGYAHSPRG